MQAVNFYAIAAKCMTFFHVQSNVDVGRAEQKINVMKHQSTFKLFRAKKGEEFPALIVRATSHVDSALYSCHNSFYVESL